MHINEQLKQHVAAANKRFGRYMKAAGVIALGCLVALGFQQLALVFGLLALALIVFVIGAISPKVAFDREVPLYVGIQRDGSPRGKILEYIGPGEQRAVYGPYVRVEVELMDSAPHLAAGNIMGWIDPESLVHTRDRPEDIEVHSYATVETNRGGTELRAKDGISWVSNGASCRIIHVVVYFRIGGYYVVFDPDDDIQLVQKRRSL